MGLRMPDRLQQTVLNDPEQLGLGGKRQLTQLIEEKGSFVSNIEFTDLICYRPGKRPPLMAEKNALNEGFRKCCTVNRNKCFMRSSAQSMDESGK